MQQRVCFVFVVKKRGDAVVGMKRSRDKVPFGVMHSSVDTVLHLRGGF